MNPWKKSCRIFVLTFALGLGGIFGFTCLVDPYSITHWATWEKLNREEPELVNQSRIVKAAALIRYHPDTIIIGSSIVDNAFSIPGSTLGYDQYRSVNLAHYETLPFIFNAGIRNGALDDALAMLKHAYLNNPNLKHIILGCEWTLFSDLKPVGGMPDTPLLGHTTLFPRGYVKYLTWMAFDDAVRTVQANNGLKQHGILPSVSARSIASAVAEWLPKTEASQAASDILYLPQLPEGFYGNMVVRMPNEVQTRLFYFAMWFTNSYLRRLDMHGAEGLGRPDSYATLREIIDFTQAHHIQLTVYASPQPPIFWAVVRKAGLWPYYEQWLRTMASITPYYDIAFLPEADNENYESFPSDSLHFSAKLGERVLPLLLKNEKKPSDGYTIAANIKAQLAHRRILLDRWEARHAYEREVVKRLTFDPHKPDDMNAGLPIPHEPTLHGLRLVRLMRDHYFALPAAEAPYDLLRVIKHGYSPMIASHSLEGVIKATRTQDLRPKSSETALPQ